MKYFLIGSALLLSSCTDMASSKYKQAFEGCMTELQDSSFDYTKRVNMCKSFALDSFYSGEELK